MTEATVKDVLYALEHGHQYLVGRQAAKGRFVWQLEPSKQSVSQRVADEARECLDVVVYGDGLNGARYGWRPAA